MFIVTQKKTFTAPVSLNIAGDNGRTQKVNFSVIFKALTKHEVDDLMATIRAQVKINEEAQSKGERVSTNFERDLIDQILVGFGDDLREEDNTPMVFTQANVDKLCSIWGVDAAITRSFMENYIKAPSKN